MTSTEPEIRLWLDDARVPPDEGWTWVRTVEDAIDVLRGGRVVEAALDNDLGGHLREGYELVEWMAEEDCWPRDVVRVHTANNFASTRMCRLIERHGFEPIPGRSRCFRRT